MDNDKYTFHKEHILMTIYHFCDCMVSLHIIQETNNMEFQLLCELSFQFSLTTLLLQDHQFLLLDLNQEIYSYFLCLDVKFLVSVSLAALSRIQ